jgi:hypothetical protein
MKSSKVERGTLYIAATNEAVTVAPLDGKKFMYAEVHDAVGGLVQTMVPARKGDTVYVNEEGRLTGLPLNKRTWEFADKTTYLVHNCFLYPPDWLVSGNALRVYRVNADAQAYGHTVSVKVAKAVAS